MPPDEFARARAERNAQVERSSKRNFADYRKRALALVYVARGEVDDTAYDRDVLFIVPEYRIELYVRTVFDKLHLIVDRVNVKEELVGSLDIVRVEDVDVTIDGRRLGTDYQFYRHLNRLIAADTDVIRVQIESGHVGCCSSVETGRARYHLDQRLAKRLDRAAGR